MKKFLLSLALLSATLLPGAAQQRSEAEAEAIAKAFMQNNGYENFNITQSAKINKVRAEKAGEITPYYIFNDTQNGGFVIVGGQEGMSDILAYSNEDCFDVYDTPPAAQTWLDLYAAVAKKAADYPEESKAEKRAAEKAFLKSDFALRKNVQPLLGEIKYNQGRPYNIMCPIITETIIQNGDTTTSSYDPATGCTQTAQAMLMRYWKWPIRPKGSKIYTFGYDSIVNKDVLDDKGNHTKTPGRYKWGIDFDKEPPYDWDNMLPRYESVTRTTNDSLRAVQDTAIARLMMHCGISNGAGYGHSTGAGLYIEEMVKYFSYAEDYISDNYGNYKNKGDEAYRAMLADELSQGRPIWAAGSAEGGGAHSYICDGYDMNALFHFNLGWNGSSNGWYEVAPTPKVPYGLGMWFHRHIHPVGRLTPTEPTRRLVFEAGGGKWNKKYTSVKNNIATFDADNKFGETIIPIFTADTEEDAENYLPGLSTVQGFMINRSDTITGSTTTNVILEAYERNVKLASPAQIDVDAIYTSDSTMSVNVSTQFPFAHTDADYKIQLVYTENNVSLNGVKYNYLMRGSYNVTDCLPDTIEADKQYIYEGEIPLPASISKTSNTTLIVILVDEKTGAVANANTLDLKQIDTWKSNNKPAFYTNEEATEVVYGFNYANSRMALPVKITNPWQERMDVVLEAESIELAENAQIQLGETENAVKQEYKLAINTVDSTMNLYLNITDTLQSSQSSIKLILKQKTKKIEELTVNFNFIKWIEGINAYTIRETGTLEKIVPQEAKDTMTIITLGGRVCGNDIIFLREDLKLNTIDMSQARIVEGPGKYNNNYTTTDDIIGNRMFQGMNVQKIILPEAATEIADYAFNLNKVVSTVVIGNNVKTIGNNAFNSCTALEKLTIPASVTETGRNAFKDCGLKYVICEGETPAKLGTQSFSGVDLSVATLVVPNEAAIETYKAASQWKNFGTIITMEQYNIMTNIEQVAEETGVSVKNGKIIVANDAEVAIYTFAGKQVAVGKAGEYALPKGNYIVKVGNNAVKVKL